MKLSTITCAVLAFSASALAQNVTVSVQGPATAEPGETITVSVVAEVTGLASTGAIAGYGLDLDVLSGAASVSALSDATSAATFQTGTLAGTVTPTALERAVGGQLPASDGLNPSVNQSTTLTLFTADVTFDAGATGVVTLRAGVSDVSGGVILYPDVNSGANINVPDEAGTSIVFTEYDVNLDTEVNTCVADFDGNGQVDLTDFGTFGMEFGRGLPGGGPACTPMNPCVADFDNNGVVDLTDFGTFGQEFGRGLPGGGAGCFE